jgi:hypothetical protein
MDGVSPDILTHASIMDGSVKYKTLKKLKLQVLCGNLLEHIEDLQEELKEAKVKEAKVELKSEEDVFFVGNGTGATTNREELELKEAVPTGDDNNGTGTTTSNGEEGEEEVMGVEEGDVNVKVNATSNKAKSAKLAKLVKLAKPTNLWCLSPYIPLSQEARDTQKYRQRKVCLVNLPGEVCTADNCRSKHPKVCLVADHRKGKIPNATCTLWHMRIPRGNFVGNSNNNNKDKYLIRLKAECRAEELKARIRETKMMS